MLVPMILLVPMAILAALAVTVLAIMLHVGMTDMGLCFIGKRELYLDNCVRRVRWCVLYVPVHTYDGAHSMSSI